jgi:2-dehydro-3-deoxygluconokinase
MQKHISNSSMGKILSFGELLLRICPDAEGSWLNDNSLPFYVGGAELNVSTALALWKVPSAYLTALPDNLITRQLIDYVEARGVDASAVQLLGDRVGLYYLHKGKDLKNAGVIYDRAHSSFSTLKPGVVNWDEVFKDVSWFHFSAICPALNQDVADVCEEALKAASERGITISLDLNYREKLWKYGKDPIDVMPALAKYCTVIMGNIWAAEKMLGIGIDEEVSRMRDKPGFLRQAEKTSVELLDHFPSCKVVANTFRFDENLGIRYYTTLYTDGKLQVSNEYTAEKIVDKVGSGDCFMAGLIYGFYIKKESAEILEFATAAAYSKLFIESDATNIGIEEIQAEMKSS